MALEVVTTVHGADAARKAERASEALFNEAIAELDEATFLEVVGDAPTSHVSREELRAGLDPVDVLVRVGLAASKGEARRFVDQGGVYVNNRRVGADDALDLSVALHDRYVVVRRGRHQLRLVVIS